MRETLRLKTWAGPLTIGSFAVIAGTGVLLFFHVNVGLVKVAHEWLSWLLVAGAVAHTAVNWKPFLAYFRKPAGAAIIGAFLALGLLSVVPSGQRGPGHGPAAFMALSSALEQSSLRVVAQVAKSSPEALIDKLRAAGIPVRDADQTIRDIASESSVRGFEVLGHVLPSPEGPPANRSRG